MTTSRVRKAGRSGRICDCLFETLKSLRFSYAAFDFVYSPCVLVSRRLQPHASQPISPRPPSTASCRQRVEQLLRLLQIAGVEAFGEPAIDRTEQFACVLHLALVAPEPRKARSSAELPGPCLLLTRDGQCALEI